MIELESVCKFYDRRREVPAVEEIDLVIGRGELVVIAGPSGAGKTTLLRLIAAEELPSTGVVRLFGHDVSRLRRSSLPMLRRRIGIVRQNLTLLPDRTALDNVALPLEVRAVPRDELRARAAEALVDVGLADRVDRDVRAMSMGEQQRVAVARAIVGEPAILLADEPTGNLDSAATTRLLDMFGRLHADGTTVVITANDRDVLDTAARNGWRTLFVEDGALREVAVSAATGVAAAPASAGDNVVPFPLAMGGTE